MRPAAKPRALCVIDFATRSMPTTTRRFGFCPRIFETARTSCHAPCAYRSAYRAEAHTQRPQGLSSRHGQTATKGPYSASDTQTPPRKAGLFCADATINPATRRRAITHTPEPPPSLAWAGSAPGPLPSRPFRRTRPATTNRLDRPDGSRPTSLEPYAKLPTSYVRYHT